MAPPSGQPASNMRHDEWGSCGKCLSRWCWWVRDEEARHIQGCLSSQVTHQSRVQRLLQDIGPMELGHVQGRGWSRRVALAGEGRWRHTEWGGALLVVLAVRLLIQRQRQPLPLLTPVAEPNTDHLKTESCVYFLLSTETETTTIATPLTSRSRPRSSEMWVISCVLGFGHFMK